MKKILNFLKYNNLTVLILAAIFLFSAGAFAQTEAGQEAIGQKQTRVEGVDNSLLLDADLDNMDMDFKIEKIESDEEYYYITYTFLDLDKLNGAWQYQLKEKTRKISKKLEKDLGVYLIEELGEEYEARIKELKEEKRRAEEQGEEKRVEITEYSGLIGRSLDLAAKVFPGYEAVKEREIASPELIDRTNMTNPPNPPYEGGQSPPNPPYEGGQADNLTGVYEEYIMTHTEEVAGLNQTESDVSDISDESGELSDATTTAEEDIFTATTTEEAPGEPEVEVIELPE
ncbi:hypothetical protein KJ586_04295 [Patescibacteria group bacterium]|nr:hypothetical protein [Patescibacteria group bacterium]